MADLVFLCGQLELPLDIGYGKALLKRVACCMAEPPCPDVKINCCRHITGESITFTAAAGAAHVAKTCKKLDLSQEVDAWKSGTSCRRGALKTKLDLGDHSSPLVPDVESHRG